MAHASAAIKPAAAALNGVVVVSPYDQGAVSERVDHLFGAASRDSLCRILGKCFAATFGGRLGGWIVSKNGDVGHAGVGL